MRAHVSAFVNVCVCVCVCVCLCVILAERYSGDLSSPNLFY
jgi:preprotein translocase subunit SecG